VDCRKSSLLWRDVASLLFTAKFFYTLWKKHPLLTPRADRGWHSRTDEESPVKKEMICWKSPDLQLEPHLAPAGLHVCSPAPARWRVLSCIPGSVSQGFSSHPPTINFSRSIFQSLAVSESCFKPEIPCVTHCSASSNTTISVSFEN